MECLLPGAFRADMFRMCALYTVGGIYMDSDILAVAPLDQIFDECHAVSIAYDRPSYTWFYMRAYQKKQMAFMAAAPGHPIFRCHMDAIVHNVARRRIPEVDVGVTGPIVFEQCYAAFPENVTIALRDTGSPCNTFVSADGNIAAVQLKARTSSTHYARMFRRNEVYC